MTARGFDYFDQMVALAQPTPHATVPPTAPTQATAQTARTVTHAANRLLVACVYCAVWAGLLFLMEFFVAVTPLGAVDLDITQPFLASVAVAVMLTIIAVVRA